MLISDSKAFIFVHVQRTGGTTLDTVLRAEVPDARRWLGTHDFARRARDELGPRWGDYFTFAFVRNPWDRLVSWYQMIVQRSVEPGAYNLTLWKYLLDHSRSFDEFIRNCTAVIEDKDGTKSFMFPQADYLCDEDGKPLVQFIGRYERYNDDARAILRRLDLSHASLPKLNASTHRDYRDYYTTHTRQIVADRFARDIDTFDYSF